MRWNTKIHSSFKERREILQLLERLKDEAITFQEMEQIGVKLRQAGKRALSPLIRELARETSGELITKYAYLLDFFEPEAWLDKLIEIASSRRDLGDDGKAALLIALEGYGVDVHAAVFDGAFHGVANPLSQAVQGAIRLGEQGVVAFLDDFLGYPSDVQKTVIRQLCDAGEPQGTRLLEAILWHEDREIVQAALAALGRVRDPMSAGILAQYLEDGDASQAEEARKSLRRLSFLGIQPPPRGEALPFHAAYATVSDGDGYRSLLISRWEEDGKLAALYMQVHQRRGLLAAWGAGGLSEEQFQQEMEGFGLQDDLHEVSHGHVLELVRDALYRSSDLSYLPADFYMRRGIFAGEQLTPAPYRPTFPEYPQGHVLSYSAGEQICRELFSHPFFAGRFVPTQRVFDLAEQYRRGDAREQLLERFCSELHGADLELIRERLLSSADLLRRCGRDGGLVRKVVALAASLAGSPLPHHLHPFLRGLAVESMEIAQVALARSEGERCEAPL
jgi:hypothetical protein